MRRFDSCRDFMESLHYFMKELYRRFLISIHDTGISQEDVMKMTKDEVDDLLEKIWFKYDLTDVTKEW